jgi:hypothetical protein
MKTKNKYAPRKRKKKSNLNLLFRYFVMGAKAKKKVLFVVVIEFFETRVVSESNKPASSFWVRRDRRYQIMSSHFF